jgi:hypothetical protein
MPRFLVIAFKFLGKDAHAFLLTELFIWLVALIIFAYLFSKLLSPQGALVSILLLGSSPYRSDFFPFMQGSGYSVVFLLFSISATLIYFAFRSKSKTNHYIFILSAVLVVYISFYFYEIAILATGFLSILVLIFRNRSQFAHSKIMAYLEASLFLIIGAIHACIILTSPNHTWNRSSISNFTPLHLFHFLSDFSVNYLKVILNPIIWILSPHLLVKQITPMVHNQSFLLFALIFLALVFCSLIRLDRGLFRLPITQKSSKLRMHFERKSVKEQNFWDSDKLKVLIGSSFLVLSPYIGFLTFGGGFPVRLSILAIPGFAILIALLYSFFDVHAKSTRTRQQVLGFFLILPIVFTFLSSYQAQSVSSVSIYDQHFERNLLAELKRESQISFPILLQIATPACAESNFWGQAYGGSIWGANNAQLNLADDFNLLDQKSPNLSRIMYIPKSVPTLPSLTEAAHKYCKSGQQIKVPDELVPIVPKLDPNYANHFQYYIDPNLKVTKIRSN